MPLYEVKLPDTVYRHGRIQTDYGNIVKVRKAVVDAPSAAAAFTTVLKSQRHHDRTKLTGLIFYGDLVDRSSTVSRDRDISRYVKPALQGATPTFSFQNTDGDRADISPEARQAARALSDKPLTPEEETRRAGIAQAISDYTQRKRAQGIFTPAQDEEAKAARIKASRARQAERGDKPRKLTYFGEEEKPKEAPPVKDSPTKQPKPVQGRLFDDTPESYLGERLDTNG